MSYGLKVSTSTGILQIDSSRRLDSSLQIVAAGSGTNPFANYPYSDDVLIFASVGSSLGSGKFQFITYRPASTGVSSGFYGGGTVNTGTNSYSITTQPSLNYILCRMTSSLGTSLSKVGNYGLQVFNADGDEHFDSRYYNGQGGFGFEGFFTLAGIQGTLIGSNDGLPPALTGTRDGNIYVNSNAPTVNRITSNLSHYVYIPTYTLSNNFANFKGVVAFNNWNTRTTWGTTNQAGSDGTYVIVYTGYYSGGTSGKTMSGYYPIRWRQRSGKRSFRFIQNSSDILYGAVV